MIKTEFELEPGKGIKFKEGEIDFDIYNLSNKKRKIV